MRLSIHYKDKTCSLGRENVNNTDCAVVISTYKSTLGQINTYYQRVKSTESLRHANQNFLGGCFSCTCGTNSESLFTDQLVSYSTETCEQ